MQSGRDQEPIIRSKLKKTTTQICTFLSGWLDFYLATLDTEVTRRWSESIRMHEPLGRHRKELFAADLSACWIGSQAGIETHQLKAWYSLSRYIKMGMLPSLSWNNMAWFRGVALWQGQHRNLLTQEPPHGRSARMTWACFAFESLAVCNVTVAMGPCNGCMIKHVLTVQPTPAKVMVLLLEPRLLFLSAFSLTLLQAAACISVKDTAKSNQGGQRRHFGDETEHFSTSASFSELIMNVYTKLDQASVGDHSKVFLSNMHVTRHEEVPCAIHDVLLQQQTPWNAACLNTKASFIGLYYRIDRLISCAQIHPLFQTSHARLWPLFDGQRSNFHP